MMRPFRRSFKKAGLPPGTLIHVGDQKVTREKLTLITYNGTDFVEKEIADPAQAAPAGQEGRFTWLNLDGLHNVALIEKIGALFEIHPLTLEDILNTEQRPKAEDFDDYLFIVLKMLYYEPAGNQLHNEQVSLVLGRDFLLSFQEVEGDIFSPVRERIRRNKGRLRKSGVDYLAYSLIDAVVDNYFIMLEQFGQKIYDLEEETLTSPTPQTLQRLHELKREMIFLRKQLWPLRELLNSLIKGGSALVNEATEMFWFDVYDHTIQVMDTVESYRDLLNGLVDLYLSTISNRMNEVMKVLTIIATIFIPMTFVAGIYGMNFEHMPELGWRFGYPLFWGVIITMAAGMIWFFKRKSWL